MGANSEMRSPPQAILRRNATLHSQHEHNPVQVVGPDGYQRHLVFDKVVDPETADPRERFEALARSVRDVLSQRWINTENTYARANPKRIYYLSMEFLIGRALANNVTNLFLDAIVKQAA